MKLGDAGIERYSRQIILDEIGGAGQLKLLAAKVLIVGSGGLGSPCAYYLAAAGVGKITIADSDAVELNNLQRQILHSTNDIGTPKVLSAARRLRALNPEVKISPLKIRVSAANVLPLVGKHDVVADCSDNFATKYLLNDACVIARRPLVHAGILRYSGQIMTIIPKKSPCLRCIFPEIPRPGAVPDCRDAGVLGASAGIFGALQAAETIKIILGIRSVLSGRLLTGGALDSQFREIQIKRNPRCAVCGSSPTIKKPAGFSVNCAASTVPPKTF